VDSRVNCLGDDWDCSAPRDQNEQLVMCETPPARSGVVDFSHSSQLVERSRKHADVASWW